MTDAIVAHSRAVLEGGSKSFAKAARVLDPDIRAGAYQLYAWCRYCDDVIDGQTLGHDQRLPDQAAQEASMAELRDLTDRAFRGDSGLPPVFEGIARTVRRHGIPERHVTEFLDGMAMDVHGRRHRTFGELEVYCYHVAGVVAVMMAHIIGIKDAETLARAESLGTGMQMTNIARDVMDDARVGRVYLPLEWLEDAGLSPNGILDPARRMTLAAVVGRLLDRADEYYRRADSGIAHLPFRSAWSIGAARWIYADIGNVIRDAGPRAWDRRAYVGTGRKIWWLLASLGRTVAMKLGA
ncbi:MAG: phytoene/squalene synthase family protein [Gemmatimonadales bacterium]